MNFKLLGVLIAIIGLTACSTTKKMADSKQSLEAQLHEILVEDSIFTSSHTGLLVKELTTGQTIFAHKADNYFTPASNTKLLTFYTCLKILEDKITGLKVYENEDSLIIWGTGDASFLNPNLEENDYISLRLKNSKKQLYFSTSNFQDDHYGSGWSWDDFNYGYQTDKHALPIHGNLVNFTKDKGNSSLKVHPAFFNKLTLPNLEKQRSMVMRAEQSNLFYYDYAKLKSINEVNRNVPYIASNEMQKTLLEEHIGESIALISDQNRIGEAEKIKSVDVDSLYTLLLQPSDNFVAEQLLLNCSSELFDTLNTAKIIEWAKLNLLSDMPNPFQWVDGSGLSRYNMTTPNNMVFLLQRIHQTIDQDRLFRLLPTGGESGTIRNLYAAEEPFIYAKTGSLRNNHSLSGYLISDRGKVYIFSFMNSNYLVPNRTLKEGMDRILRLLKAKL